MEQRKRSHEEFEEDVSKEAAQVATEEEPLAKKIHIDNDHIDEPTHNPKRESRQSNRSRQRAPKKKREQNDYPTITHAAHARLQSVVKVSDLQSLVLYLLADGNGPQWCSVRHHSNFKKVVVLMVPGLEISMFDGSLALPVGGHGNADEVPGTEDVPPNGDSDVQNANGRQDEQPSAPGDENWQVVGAKRKSYTTPDEFYPKRLQKDRLPQPLLPLASIFEHVWPIKTPGDDRFSRMHSPLASMLTVPIPKNKDKNGNGPSAPAEAKGWQSKRVLITEYVATTSELMLEGYTLHPAHFAGDPVAAKGYQETRMAERTSTADGWLDTPGISSLADGDVSESKIEQGAITAGRSILAIDCEMCITSPPDVLPPVYSLTRMSVIDWDGSVVLDEFVRPADPITNYLTPYSGITPAMLENVTTTLQDAQQMLLAKITPHTILVGHSLDSDLKALHLTHPFIIDTSLLYPHPRGPPLKSSLKWLAQKYLNRSIQAGHGSTGHNSIEDAQASLDLVKQKCDKGKLWGTSEASNESIFQRLSRTLRPKRQKTHPDAEEEPRLGAVVDWGDPRRGFGGQAKVAAGCKNDSDVVNGVKSALTGDIEGELVPGGADLVWARLRELEAYREWWSSSKTQDVDALRLAVTESNDKALLGDVVAKTVSRIEEIWQSLPACTAFIVYSGSGDPRKLSQLQGMKQKHKEEYAVKKWDQLSIKWTDTEEQELRRACDSARRGLGLIAAK